MTRPPDSTVERWHRNFWASSLSLRQYAREIGVATNTLKRRFRELGLPTDKRDTNNSITPPRGV